MQCFLGRDLDAIILTRFDGYATEALSDNFLKLQVIGRHTANQMVSVRIQELRYDGLVGHLRHMA